MRLSMHSQIRGAIADGIAQSNESAAQYSYRRRLELDRVRSIAPRTLDNASDYIAELTDVAALLAIGVVIDRARPAGLDFEDPQPAPAAYGTMAWHEMQFSVLQEIERLPPAEKSVMQQHYLNGVEFKHIAAMLGVGKSRVSQLHRAALERLRARLQVSE